MLTLWPLCKTCCLDEQHAKITVYGGKQIIIYTIQFHIKVLKVASNKKQKRPLKKLWEFTCCQPNWENTVCLVIFMVLLSEQTALQCQILSRTLYKNSQSNYILYIHTLLSSSTPTITSVSNRFIGPAEERERKLVWCCVKHCLTQQVWCNGISQCSQALAGVWSYFLSQATTLFQNTILYIWITKLCSAQLE